MCGTSHETEQLNLEAGYEYKIKVIGSGCENCDKTNAVVKECLEELGMDTEIERVTDLVEIVKLGVMTAPSVMIDGKLVVAGQVPSKKQMMKILKK